MFGHLAAGGGSTVEPAVPVELDDVVDRNLLRRQLTGQRPQAVSPEVVATAVDEMGMMLAVHVGRLDER